MPSWLTEPPAIETDPRLENSGNEEAINCAEEDEALEQQYVNFWPKNPLADPVILRNFEKCVDIDGIYSWAATYGIDVRKYPKLLFSRLCNFGKPLSFLLQVLEDADLRTSSNFRILLEWLVNGPRSDGTRQQVGLIPGEMALLQKWISRQLYLGLMSEKDISRFLRFVSCVSHGASDKMSACELIASFQGLQSSPVYGFRDLTSDAQRKLLMLIVRGPVTRQLLQMGFSLVETMPYLYMEGTDQKITFFIRRLLYAHASPRVHEKRVRHSPELVQTILETIWGLPGKIKDSVILMTTEALIHDHLHMPVEKVGIMQVSNLWLSALAKSIIHGNWSLMVNIEDFLGTQKLEVVVPYLQQFDDRKQACFVLRYWFGHRSQSGHDRALHLFDRYYFKKGKESSWVSMLQAAQQHAWEYSQPLGAPIRQIFKSLQALGQSESIVEIVKQSRKLKAIIDDEDVLYIIREHLEQQPHLAERLFHFHPRLWLERCPELAERLILDPTSHPETVLGHMRAYTPLSLAHPERFPRESYSQRRIQLLGRMALAYSSAPHLSPRLAFERVYECYIQHLNEGLGPLPVATARALTRAGIIRPFQIGQRVDMRKIRWILSVIWSTEGADVADRIESIVDKWRKAN